MKQITVQTGSDNTKMAYAFLKERAGEEFTIAEIANALGLTSPQVTGGVVSLAKKDLLFKGTKLANDKNGIEKEYKSFRVNPEYEVTFETAQKASGKLTDNGVRLLQFLQENAGEELTHGEIAESLGWKTIAVVGAATTLDKKGLITKPERQVEMPDTGEMKTLKVVVLTEEGKNYQF